MSSAAAGRLGGMRILVDNLAFPESPRWDGDRLLVSDWGAGEVVAVDSNGTREIVACLDSFPMCIDRLPDGRLLLVSSADRALLRQEVDGSLVRHSDLSALAQHPWNEIVVDGRGRAYVNNIGFDFPAGDFAPGIVALVAPDGSARRVADGLAFPNGMVVTPDDSTLIVAESYGNRLTAFDVAADGSLSNRRTWADLPGGYPDGICLDAENAVWYADVPNRCCVRVREGGEVLDTIRVDRGCFACALGGEDGRTLFLVANEWAGRESMAQSRAGQVLVARAPAPAPARL